MEGYNEDTREYHNFAMMFGWGMSPVSKQASYYGKKIYPTTKKYYYPDKRTKKYGAQRVELLKNGKTNSRIKK
jgi:hypothetical protein|tara:strand:+ start:3618 stop:3836 length:219 start_codon:yes stop_codon:yes gene_type:complete